MNFVHLFILFWDIESLLPASSTSYTIGMSLRVKVPNSMESESICSSLDSDDLTSPEDDDEDQPIKDSEDDTTSEFIDRMNGEHDEVFNEEDW